MIPRSRRSPSWKSVSPRGAIIRGRILDERGEPNSSAYLTRESSGTALTLNGWDERCRADGSFEYGGLSTQRLFYSLIAQAPGYRKHSISSVVNTPDDVIEKRFGWRKTPPGNRRGVSRNCGERKKPTRRSRNCRTNNRRNGDRCRGHPRGGSGCAVWGTFLWDSWLNSATTDAAGRYSLPQPPGEAGAILVTANEFAPQFVGAGTEAERVDVQLSPGQTVRRRPGHSRRAGAGVQVIPLVRCIETGFCNPIWLDERSTHTNGRGEFEIAAIPEMVSFDLLKAGYSEQPCVTLVGNGVQNEIKLTAAAHCADRCWMPPAKRSAISTFGC